MSNHDHCCMWWDETIGLLQQNDIQNDGVFREAYRIAMLPANLLDRIPNRAECSLSEIVAFE